MSTSDENSNDDDEIMNLLKGVPPIFNPTIASRYHNSITVVNRIKSQTDAPLLYEEKDVLIPIYSAFFESMQMIPIKNWKRIQTKLKSHEDSTIVTKKEGSEETTLFTIDYGTIIIDPVTYWFFMETSSCAFIQDEQNMKRIIGLTCTFDTERTKESLAECNKLKEQLIQLSI